MCQTVPEVADEGGVRFAVLGPFRAERDGQEIDLGPRLQRKLLVILVVEAGHVVPVDRLIDLLWPDGPPAAAIASVQAYISQLRRVLEPGRPPRAPARLLITKDPGYVLRAEGDQLDVPVFQSLARQAHGELADGDAAAAAVHLDRALVLWRGDPLPEFADEPWAMPEVARLTESYDLALEDRVDAWLTLGRHGQAASEAEAMVNARPLRERRWGQLIVATYRSGRQADALRAYQRCRSMLAAELGVDPGPQLRQLEAAVLAQDPALDWRPPAGSTAGVGPAAAAGPSAEAHSHRRVPLPAKPAMSHSLVGRDEQLAHLRSRLDQLADGHGGAVVLVGEPGAGKTAIAETIADVAAAAGITTAWGRCLDAASTPAYWPWSRVLGSLPDGPKLNSASRYLDGEVGERGDTDENARQFQAYEAVVAAIGEATADALLLVVIDDLHAADDASLSLLQLLAGDLHRSPALFVLTVRDTEPSKSLERTLGELLRHPGAERMPVPPFTTSDVGALLECLTAGRPRPEVIAAAMHRTGGNPFYTTELVRLLNAEHRHRELTAADVVDLDVPSGIRDVLLRRVHRLPEDTQSLLMVAAVADAEPELDLLERVARIDAEALLLGLEPAVAAGLLTATDAGWGLRFRHPLIRDSLLASLGRVERARLHARVAAALEYNSPVRTAASLARLSHHYLSAGPFGDPAKAISYTREAARWAVRQGAWHDAARHLEQALTAISPALPDADATRCDVLLELGQARRSAGMVRLAHAALNEAIRLAELSDDDDRMLAAALAFGAPTLWGSREWGEDDPHLVALLERQLDRIGSTSPADRVRILSTMAAENSFGDTAERGWAYASEALDISRPLGRPEVLGLAVSACLMSALSADHLRERRTILEEMLDGRHRALPPHVQALLHISMLTEWMRLGELARFDGDFPAAWRLATDQLHSPELQAQLRLSEGFRHLLAGHVQRGADLAERSFAAMSELTPTWGAARFILDSCIMLVKGTLADHAERLADRIASPEHPSLPHLLAPAAALGFLQRGTTDRAREIVSRWFVPPPMSWTRIQAIAYWAQVAIELGVPDPAWLHSQLLPHAGELAIVGAGADCGGAVDSLLAGLAERLGQRDEAAKRAREGLALETLLGSQIWIKRTENLLDRITRVLRRTGEQQVEGAQGVGERI